MKAGPVVIALGGHALDDVNLKNPQRLSQLYQSLAAVAGGGLLVTHGNGPQIGSRAMSFLSENNSPSLDTLGAETEGLLGYQIELELANHLSNEDSLASIITMVEVNAEDPAFDKPTKPVGNLVTQEEADYLKKQHGWQFIRVNSKYRRVVPSPSPGRILQINAIEALMSAGVVTICAGGGGIPVIRNRSGRLEGVDAVIDKDYTSALLALAVDARLLVIATNVDGVYRDWNGNRTDKITECEPETLSALDLPDGSMGPKVKAACDFVRARRKPAVIGAVEDIPELLKQQAGTRITVR